MKDPNVPAVFEAAFEYNGVRIRADIVERLGAGSWGLREVKSSTQPKDEHYDDIAIQLYVLRGSGVQIGSVELIHVNGNYVGDDGPIVWREYFARIDVNAAVEGRLAGLAGIVSEQHAVLQRPRASRVQPTHHCHVPFSCEFWDRCTARKPDDWIFNLPL